jgi:uncharacterized damage-inducible protein DinB
MLLSALLCAATLAPVHATVSELTAKDREFAVKYLEETRQKFLASIEGVSPAQWTFKAGPDRWSIAEVAEHIAISESTILQLITAKIVTAPPAPAGAERLSDQKMLEALVDRSARFQAPEMLKPTNRWSTREALAADFNASRDKTIAYVRDTKDDLRAHAAPHPVLKTLDGYQWLLLIGGHSGRHTAQIQEVKADPGYPKQ